MTRMISRRQAIATSVAAAAMPAFAAPSFAAAPFRDVHYQSGRLNIQAYFYRPAGPGPFPLVIYNHGSREGQERQSIQWVKIAQFFVAAGYAVLVPERRGYGKSDGPTWSEAVGNDTSSKFIRRCKEETDDVLAAVDFATKFPAVDHNRIGVVGWSLGGIMTMLAIAQSPAFRGAVNQAGGALTWRHSPMLQSTLEDAAGSTQCPVLLMDDENDAAPEDIPAIASAMAKANRPHDTKMYPAFTPPPDLTDYTSPGHVMFGAAGMSIWGPDAIAFLDAHVKG